MGLPPVPLKAGRPFSFAFRPNPCPAFQLLHVQLGISSGDSTVGLHGDQVLVPPPPTKTWSHWPPYPRHALLK